MGTPSRGQIVTFYSYKGGTGRSMALANVAWILASNQKKVLVLDWDLEAPGLHRYFYPFLVDTELGGSDGLIDLVINFAVAAATHGKSEKELDEDWYKPYADISPYTVSLEWDFGEGTLDFMPAGRQGESYSTRVNTFNWQNLYDRLGGAVFLEAVRERMRKNYDYILVDSRTGVSDTSGICTVQMPDILVVCFALNNQGIEGASAVANSVYEQRQNSGIRIFPVPMRVDPFEKDKLDLMKKYAKEKFAQFPDHIPPEKREQYWGEGQVPYIAYYAYHEILATFGDSPGEPNSVLAAAERLTAYLTEGAIRHLDADSVLARQDILDQYARRPASRQSHRAEATEGRGQVVKLRLEQAARKRKTAALPFDVFLSHSSSDQPLVERIAERLKQAGLEPWLGTWYLTPGGDWQDELAAGLGTSSACAVFVGPHSLDSWERAELNLALDRAAKDRTFRLFTVLLPGLPEPLDPSTLPPFLSTRTWADLRKGIEDPRAFQLLIKAIKGIAFALETPLEARVDICPYRGLQPFYEEQAEFFFGRDGDIQRLLEKLKATRFLAVIGPSGSGKSSLVQAGLIPALKKGALPYSDTWAIRVLKPGAYPLTALASDLLRFYPQAKIDQMIDQMRTDAYALHMAVNRALDERQLLAPAEGRTTERVVWVIDQFEEVFTLCRDERERLQFIDNLLYAAFSPDGRSAVILIQRADFYPQCAVYPELSARIAAQQFLVSPMDIDGLRQSIEEPARRVGLEFEPDLVETILDDVARQPGALPLLEHALLELWERRRGQMLTLEAYRESGGVAGAIAKRADAIYLSFTLEQQAIARRIILRLIQPGERPEEEDTPRRTEIGELITNPSESDAVESVVRALADARLLTTSNDEQTGERFVEVSHVTLIRGWPRLWQWIEADRSWLRVHRRLTEAAQEWQRLNRDEGALYRGARLVLAVWWREQNETALNQAEREFLDASTALKKREEEEKEERQRRELESARKLAEAERQRTQEQRIATARLRRWARALAVISLLAVGVAIFAVTQRRQAQDNAQLSESRELAVAALNSLNTAPERSVLLALPALLQVDNLDKTPILWNDAIRKEVKDARRQAEEALHWAVQEVRWPAIRTLDHNGTVYGAAFSPDSKRLATASGDRTVRVWDAESGEVLRTLSDHADDVWGVAFSPDGERLASASKDKTVKVWDAESGQALRTLSGHTAGVNVAAFSPDGRRLATASDDGTARVWDARSGRALLTLSGHTDKVFRVAFSPDGRRLVTASVDRTARVWDAKSGKELLQLSGHTDRVYAAVFSPDGRRLATVSADGTAKVWGAADGQPLLTLSGHDDAVRGIAFSPDGNRLATASADRTARVWDAKSGKELLRLRGHTDRVWSLAFSPDGKRLATASSDQTAKVWDVPSGHTDRVHGVAFSPDGRRLATASADKTVKMWDAESGNELRTLSGHTDEVHAVTFSPDGRWLATASADKTAKVWDAESGHELLTFDKHEGPVYGVAFSPDGRWLATASADKMVKVWNSTSGKESDSLPVYTREVYGVAFSPDGKRLATADYDKTGTVWNLYPPMVSLKLSGHDDRVFAIAFSPDGRRLATASGNGAAKVWDAESGQELLTFDKHEGPVYSIAFSPDGRRLATASADKTVRIWDSQSGQKLLTLSGHDDAVQSVAFSPDGKRLATASWDKMVRVYLLPIEDLMALAHKRVPRELTPEERQKYVH